MHVGYAAFFQNPGRHVSDKEMYENEMRMALQAEPLGFESVWTTEHHFTDYLCSPDVVAFLSYLAGATKHALLGSMVMILPWHDPVRVAEQVAMLDHMSGGRMIFGMGRGLGRIEFEGFRTDMGKSREIFVEYAQAIMEALETGVIKGDGEHFQLQPLDIRPEPYKTFKGRTYAASLSPDSMPVLAKLGIGLLVIPQKPWPDVKKDFSIYRDVYLETNGTEPPPPLAGSFCYTDEDPIKAREEGARWIAGYYDSMMKHYEFGEAGLQRTGSYEYYNRINKYIAKHGDEGAKRDFVDLMPYGTPDEVIDKMRHINSQIHNNGFMVSFSYGGMPYNLAEQSMQLFAKKVLPAVKQIDSPPVGALKSA